MKTQATPVTPVTSLDKSMRCGTVSGFSTKVRDEDNPIEGTVTKVTRKGSTTLKEEVLFQSLRMPKSFGKIWVVLKRTNLFVVVVKRADSSCNLLLGDFLGCWFLL